MHYPLNWKFRLLHAVHGSGYRENRRLLRAWARAEGGTAHFNPLNTTEPWPGSWNYNSVGVKDYPSGSSGIGATAATLTNGNYDGIVADLRRRKDHKTAKQIATDNAKEFDTWGTGSANILRLL